MVAAVDPSRFKLEPTTWLMWVPTNHLGKNQPNQPTSRILQCPGEQALSKSFLCVGNDELYLLLVNTGNTTSHSYKSQVAESMWAPSTFLAPLNGPAFLKDTGLEKFCKLLQHILIVLLTWFLLCTQAYVCSTTSKWAQAFGHLFQSCPRDYFFQTYCLEFNLQSPETNVIHKSYRLGLA